MHLTVALCLGLYAMFSLYTLHADVTIKSITTNLPPVVNRTDGDCFYSCPFNNRSSSEYIEWLGVGTSQPCVYTVEVARVFKGNYTVSCSAPSPMHSSCYASMYTYKMHKNSHSSYTYHKPPPFSFTLYQYTLFTFIVYPPYFSYLFSLV